MQNPKIAPAIEPHSSPTDMTTSGERSALTPKQRDLRDGRDLHDHDARPSSASLSRSEEPGVMASPKLAVPPRRGLVSIWTKSSRRRSANGRTWTRW